MKENHELLRAEVLEWVCRYGETVWTDLEGHAGGRCPWKRLGEREAAGSLRVVGKVPGKYGRSVKVYRVVAACAS